MECCSRLLMVQVQWAAAAECGGGNCLSSIYANESNGKNSLSPESVQAPHPEASCPTQGASSWRRPILPLLPMVLLDVQHLQWLFFPCLQYYCSHSDGHIGVSHVPSFTYMWVPNAAVCIGVCTGVFVLLSFIFITCYFIVLFIYIIIL